MTERAARAVVLAGGDACTVGPGDLAGEAPRFVVAADSGLHLAERLGLAVDVVVGDLDSARPDAVARAEAGGARVERHPEAKDETDLELALDVAMRHGCSDVVVVGFDGGRLDHLLANVLLLAAPRFAAARITAVSDSARLTVVHDDAVLRGAPGSLVTLLAVGGPAHGVRTTGLRYPLAGETLLAGSSRGVSNVLGGEEATVHLDSGVLLAVQPRQGD